MAQAIRTATALTVEAPISVVFGAACGYDIPAVIKKRGVLPGVLKVENHQGAWSKPGQVRLLCLSDGSSVREELIEFTPEQSYAYRVSSFTGPFAALVSEGRGEWNFSQTGPNSTRIDWTYEMTPKSFWSGPAVWFVVKLLWPGYIRSALQRLKQEIERSP